MAVKTASKTAAKKVASKATSVAPTAATKRAPAKVAKPVKAVPVKAATVVAKPEPARVEQPARPKPSAPSAKQTGRVLSEAEILASPEKEYMNSAQLLFFRTRLHNMEQDILRNAGETTEHLRESIIVPDPADRATIEEEHALELRTRDRERKLLKKIQQSIQRIDSGEYGYCEETGDPIGVPRLLARPTATLSLEAQERREMKQKMFGE